MLARRAHPDTHPNSFTRLRSSRPTPWNRLIVLANRAPFSHERGPDGRIQIRRTGSGLVTALEPLLETYSGTWVAHGSGTADRLVVDGDGGLDVPPSKPRYRLRYVWLEQEEHRGYYYGFANEALWPLCHHVDVQPVFRPSDFDQYSVVNRRFADAVVEEAVGGSPVILVQDYHFALAPRVLRQRLQYSAVVAFWHIPWPPPAVFRTCPPAHRLLDGLLGANVIGLQTDEDRLNLLGCVESMLLHADVDWNQNTVTFRGQTTRVRAYPVGVEWANKVIRTTAPATVCREQVCRTLQLPSDIRLCVGVDRMDYTKGIHHKLLAVERLLEVHPELRERFAFVQIAEPSRDPLPAYQAARRQMLETQDRVNKRFRSGSYRPIHVLEAHYESPDVYRFYRAADFCYVGSLDDGMNLVAKEFVSARDDERGVLVLSRFAGAADQLGAALLINPYDVDRTADALAQALRMSIAEQAKRMRLLRENVKNFSAAWWAQQLLRDAVGETRSAVGLMASDEALANQVPA